MADLKTDLRSYFDALVDMPALDAAQMGTPELEARRSDLAMQTFGPSRRRRSRLVAGCAGLAVVAVAAGSILVLQPGRDASHRPAGDGLVTVTHQVIQYSRTADSRCATRETSDGGFDREQVDVWERADEPVTRIRVRYPDGSTYDIIRVGAGAGPAVDQRLYTRGRAGIRSDGCGGGGSMQAPSVGNGIFADLRHDRTYRRATPGGPGQDSLGRAATTWHATALVSFTAGTAITGRVDDSTTWYTDSKSGDVLERVVTSHYDGIGDLTHRTTSLAVDEIQAPETLFSLDGYEAVHTSDTAVTTTSTTSAP